jgi:DNA-binding transcriptional LysR family regulator
MHERAANPSHYDTIVQAFRGAGLTPRIVQRTLAFDPTMRAVRDGTGAALIGASATRDLAPGLCWIPLTDPAARVSFELVLRDGDPSPAVDRFERTAVATAAAERWLEETESTDRR